MASPHACVRIERRMRRTNATLPPRSHNNEDARVKTTRTLPPVLSRLQVALASLLIAAAPLGGAQVYKWVDEKGVVNYGSKPPAYVRGGKSAAVVEDRVSVYTPDQTLVDETQRARERSAQRPSGTSLTPEAPPQRRAEPGAPAAPVRSAAEAPCVTGNEAGCAAYPGYYDGPPVVFGGGRRPPRLDQPVLPPGATAGQVNAGAGYTPGLSTQPPMSGSTTARRAPSASFTLKERDDRGDHRDRGRR